MAKSKDEQVLLDHIWKDLHEKGGRSAEAADMAKSARLKYRDNPEMWGELAAMEMVTAGAAAKKSEYFTEAYTHLVHSAEVVIDTFPLGVDESSARERGNAWDPVYGNASAQLEVLRSYYHLIERLTRIIGSPEFASYSTALWHFLLRMLREAGNDSALLLLTIEYAPYADAKTAFTKFQQESLADTSRQITTGARMLNRALVEADYETALAAFKFSLQALTRDRNQLTHFSKQVASNVRADKTVKFNEKLGRWNQELSGHDLKVFAQLLQLNQVGLGKDRVEKID